MKAWLSIFPLMISTAVPSWGQISISPRQGVGELPDGGFLLNTGWRISPAGKQIPLDTLPMATVLSPDGRYLLALNGGYKPPSISVVDVSQAREIARVPVSDGWLGLRFSAKGDSVYVGGGSQAAVFEFRFSDGHLRPARIFSLAENKPAPEDFIGDVALSPDGRWLYAAALYRDSVIVVDLHCGRVVKRFRTGRRPYRILVHPDGKSFFVTSWADGHLHHHRADSGETLATVALGPHTTDMVWRPGGAKGEVGNKSWWTARLFVAAANTNHVYALGVSAKELRVIEKISVSLTPRQPPGMTPSALALNAEQNRLLVACSDANAVAVVDVLAAESRVLGFLPVGWYPTAVQYLLDGRTVVLNGRGSRSFPNPDGPAPGDPAKENRGYVGSLQTGTASVIDRFDEKQLGEYTKTVLANSPYRDEKLDDAGAGPNNPIPARPGGPSPIRHVIYIVKENRTYDQVLGDLGIGNGDPSLTLFGENVTPNHHKLAREFVLFDNFYVNADVSKDGWYWSTAAIGPDFVQKLWPNRYAHRDRTSKYYGTEEAAASPPAGFLWTRALARGLTVRNFGFFVANRKKPTAQGIHVESVLDPALKPFTNFYFRGLDGDYSDFGRAQLFLRELAEFEKKGELPRLILLRLGNDHTKGAQGGKLTPSSLVADNDHALGLVVEAVSKSRFWPRTAIFVLEDDAQDGPDHVDSHRSAAYAISPYIRRRAIDSTMYNTTSMLRTIELILGLSPMTHFDAGAAPMFRAFTSEPDLTPYIAEKPRVSLTDRNPSGTELDKRTRAMDFSEADMIDDAELNDILWRSIRGAEAPPPVRSYFSQR